MRFDFKAYEKVYPAHAAPQAIDTAVDGFNPTAEKVAEKAKDDMPGEPDPKPEDTEEPETDPAGSEDLPPEGE